MTNHSEEDDFPSPEDIDGYTEHPEQGSLRPLVLQTVGGLVVIVILLVLGALFFREPIQGFATWLVETFGMAGLLIGLMLSDTLTAPIPPDVMLFTAAASPDIPQAQMLITACIVSTLGGSVAYFIGPHLRHVPFLHRRIEAFRPRGEAMFERWGVWAVVIGALSPLPYSIVCWFAGIYKMEYKRFAIATLFRMPRIAGYYALFYFGWSGLA